MLRKIALVLVFLTFLSLVVGSFYSFTYAIDPVDDLQNQINELEKLKKLSEDATKPLENQLAGLEARINAARNGIKVAQAQLEKLKKDIKKREVDLAVQYKIFARRVSEQYKRKRSNSNLLSIIASETASQLTRDLAYRSSVKAQDKKLVQTIGEEIMSLESDSKALEQRQLTLTALSKQLDEQAKFFRGEIGKAKSYQRELTGKIAELSAKQQAIINARSGVFTTSVGEVPLSDDFNASIGYKAKAPNNSFAVFAFGAYTHRKGMSQYGAKARADAGQSVEDILKAYYPGSQLKKDYPVMNSITVDGVGTIPFEDQYLHGIYEMPASWHINALKAQAIAARTYALRYTNNGAKSICTSERCQVFKNERKGGDWEKAVQETRGWVLVDGSGKPISTQYASTHGGYSTTSGWDTTDGSGGGDWSTRAWENKAGSPWFYKAWYRSGYLASGASCGRSHPWISEQEMADIINAWIVMKNPEGVDTSRIQPVTINQCSIGGGGGNPYSMDELKDKANHSGGAVTKINDVSTSHNNNGQTASVKFSTNRGEITISGGEFKKAFNLRAPGYLRIPQSSFASFNVEYKR